MKKYDLLSDLELEVISFFEDEESRDIFYYKTLYNKTGKNRYLKKMIEEYIPDIRDLFYDPESYSTFESAVSNKHVWIRGAGVRGKRIANSISGTSKICGFIDNSKSLIGTKINGINVYDISEVVYDSEDVFIISMSDIDVSLRCKQELINIGVKTDNIILYAKYEPSEMNDWHYFDGEIITYSDNEKFVDAGCFDLNTSIIFSKHCEKNGVSNYSIIAFEPDLFSYEKILKKSTNYNFDVKVVNGCLWSERSVLKFNQAGSSTSSISNDKNSIDVKAYPLDEFLDEKITFIKMDIEGAELNALQGCKRIIEECKPKLAISVYHKESDMIDISTFIRALNPDYKLYLRHYSNSQGETVLYAI